MTTYNKSITDAPFAIMTGNRENPTVFPANHCWVTPGQVYRKKLSPSQMQEAIPFTTKRPQDRLQTILQGIGAGRSAGLDAPVNFPSIHWSGLYSIDYILSDFAISEFAGYQSVGHDRVTTSPRDTRPDLKNTTGPIWRRGSHHTEQRFMECERSTSSPPNEEVDKVDDTGTAYHFSRCGRKIHESAYVISKSPRQVSLTPRKYHANISPTGITSAGMSSNYSNRMKPGQPLLHACSS